MTGKGRLGLSLGGLVPEVPEASPAVSGHDPSAAPMPSAMPPPPPPLTHAPGTEGLGFPRSVNPAAQALRALVRAHGTHS